MGRSRCCKPWWTPLSLVSYQSGTMRTMLTELAKQCPLKVNPYTMDSPHTKTSLLLQSHFSRLTLPCSDYLTDTKSVMDNAPRVLQAMIDICAESGWLASTLRVLTMLQMI